MSSFELNLPFPRGKTACDGVNTPVAGNHEQFVGKEYLVDDSVHGTNVMVRLRAVKLESNITFARKLYKFDTDALDFGSQITGVNDSAGGPCIALDDKYTVGESLLANDVVWAIVEGPCFLLTELTSVSLTAHNLVTSDASGYVDGAAPGAGHYCIGRIDATSSTTNASVVVHISKGFAGGEGT